MAENDTTGDEAEWDAICARAGLTIPAERRDAVGAGYLDFRRQLLLLHGPRSAASEPASIFSLDAITRQQ